MVFLKLRVSYGGLEPGELIDVNDAKARHLIRTGKARYHNWDDREETGHFLDSAGFAPADAAAPPQSATKAEWVDYAVSQGVDRTEAEALTKADLIGLFNSEGDG